MPRVFIWILLLAGLCMPGVVEGKPRVAEVTTLSTPGPVNSFFIASSGLMGAGLFPDGRLLVWSLPEGRLLRTIELGSNDFELTANSPDGRLFLTGTPGGEVEVWDTGNGKRCFKTRLLPTPYAAEFSRDNRYLAASGSGGPVQVFDLSAGNKLYELESVPGGTFTMAFSPEGSRIATADTDTQVRIYDSRTGKLIARNTDFLMEPFSVCFTPDGKQVIAAGADKVVVFLDARTGQVVKRLKKQAHPIVALAVSDDGESLATMVFNFMDFSQPTPLALWEVGSGHKRSEWVPPSGILDGEWTDNGHYLAATATEKAVHIWRVY